MDVVDARERQNVGRSFITNTRGVLRTFSTRVVAFPVCEHT